MSVGNSRRPWLAALHGPTAEQGQKSEQGPKAQKDRRAEQALALSALFGAVFLVIGIATPFLPVWLRHRGLNPEQIGIILATPLFMRVAFAPVLSFWADRRGNRLGVLVRLTWISLVAYLALAGAHAFAPILIIATVQAIAWSGAIPLCGALAMGRVQAFGLDYGRLRLWGSLTFIGASLACGLFVDWLGERCVIWLLVAGALGAAVIATLQPRGDVELANRRSIRIADGLGLLANKVFVWFILADSFLNASHAALYAFGTLHWQAQGFTNGSIGALWAIGVIAEIVVFAWSAPLLGAWGPLGCLLIGALAAVARWLVMTGDPSIALLFLLQILHGATFGLAHLGGMHFIAGAVSPALAGTAQGLASASGGVVMGFATLIAGPVYARTGGGAFGVMALLGLAAAVFCLLARRTWDGGILDKQPSVGSTP